MESFPSCWRGNASSGVSRVSDGKPPLPALSPPDGQHELSGGWRSAGGVPRDPQHPVGTTTTPRRLSRSGSLGAPASHTCSSSSHGAGVSWGVQDAWWRWRGLRWGPGPPVCSAPHLMDGGVEESGVCVVAALTPDSSCKLTIHFFIGQSEPANLITPSQSIN